MVAERNVRVSDLGKNRETICFCYIVMILGGNSAEAINVLRGVLLLTSFSLNGFSYRDSEIGRFVSTVNC